MYKNKRNTESALTWFKYVLIKAASHQFFHMQTLLFSQKDGCNQPAEEQPLFTLS